MTHHDSRRALAARKRQGALVSLLSAMSLAGLLAVAAPSVLAHSYKLGELSIGHIWAPPPSEGAKGLPVYGPFLNNGEESMTLEGASSPLAERVTFRSDEEEAEELTGGLEIAPGKPYAMAPWRPHLWVVGLKESLEEGDSLELTLDFGEAGQKTIEVEIEEGGSH